ncbi:MAG TPA: ankyrin repeat domain-containing protein [Vicinamibacteria bacterium]|nr:ankyrin repeat domain-containing protein [Vicinamibacteria bacterium]
MRSTSLSVALAVFAVGYVTAADEPASRRLVGAEARGDVAQVKTLLAQGADPDAGDRSGWTGLHQAAETGDLALARVLLEAGAHPDVRARSRGTPLDVAERAGRSDLARLLRAHGARGSGKSIGDTVCVRPWKGDGFCAVVEGVDPTRFRLRVSRVVGCEGGCAPEASCSAGQLVGPGGLGPGDALWVPASCLTHTGVKP